MALFSPEARFLHRTGARENAEILSGQPSTQGRADGQRRANAIVSSSNSVSELGKWKELTCFWLA